MVFILQNCKTINSCCFKPLSFGTLLQQPQKTNTFRNLGSFPPHIGNSLCDILIMVDFVLYHLQEQCLLDGQTFLFKDDHVQNIGKEARLEIISFTFFCNSVFPSVDLLSSSVVLFSLSRSLFMSSPNAHVPVSSLPPLLSHFISCSWSTSCLLLSSEEFLLAWVVEERCVGV